VLLYKLSDFLVISLFILVESLKIQRTQKR